MDLSLHPIKLLKNPAPFLSPFEESLNAQMAPRMWMAERFVVEEKEAKLGEFFSWICHHHNSLW